MSDKRFCLQCNDGTLLVHGIKDVTGDGPAVSGWHCPVCDAGLPKLTLAQKLKLFDPVVHGGEVMESGRVGTEVF